MGGKGRGKRGLISALAFSLLLHAALLGFVYTAFLQGPPPPEAAASLLRVGLVVPRPGSPFLDDPLTMQRTGAVPGAVERGARLPDQESAAGETQLSPGSAPRQASSPPAAESPPARPQRASELTQSQMALPSAPPFGESRPDVGSLDRARLQSNIATFLSDYRQGLQDAWHEACWREREGRGRRDCPDQTGAEIRPHDEERRQVAELFEDLRRDEHDARLVGEFATQNASLKTLLAGKGPLALLAAERYALNRQYQEYLSGNFNYAIWNFVQMTQSGNGNLPFLRDLYQGVCDPAPCVYVYSPFRVQRPAEADEAARARAGEEAELSADALPPLSPFRLAAPLFRARPGG